MSTVALRGILSYDEKTKGWSWKGRWVFGDCVPLPVTSTDAVFTDGSSKTLPTEGDRISASAQSSKSKNKHKNNQNKKQNVASQPFLYQWKQPSEPSMVAVPSLNVKVIGAAEDDEGGGGDERESKFDTMTAQEQEPSPPPRRTIDDKSKTQPVGPPSSDTIASIDQSGSVSGSGSTNHQQLPSPIEGKEETNLSDNAAGKRDKQDSSNQKTKMSSTSFPLAPTGINDTQLEENSNKKKASKGDNENVECNEATKGSTISAEKQSNHPSTVEAQVPSTSAIIASEKTEEKGDEKAIRSECSQVVRKSNENFENNVQKQLAIDCTRDDDEEKLAEGATEKLTSEPSSEVEQLNVKTAIASKVTFASVMPKFLDASTKFKSEDNNTSRCPSSGQWKGYFENVIPGKRSGRSRAPQPPQIQKVSETFYLFLNATPSSTEELMVTTSKDIDNNRSGNNSDSIIKDMCNGNPAIENQPSLNLFAFETTTKDHIPRIPNRKSSEEPSPNQAPGTTPVSTDVGGDAKTKKLSLVQVRGCGENEFGTFEIMGYLDLNTMVMEIQRQYVVTEVAAVSPPAATRRRRSSPNSASVSEGPRPHSTRKRNPTWKRASSGPEDDRRRKRMRPLSAQKQTQEPGITIDSKTGNAATESNSSQLFPATPFAVTSSQIKPASKSDLLAKCNSNPLPSSVPSSTLSDVSIPSSVNSGSVGRGSKSRLVLPVQTKSAVQPMNNYATGVSNGKRRSSIGGHGVPVRAKRRSSAIGKPVTGSASMKSGSTYIRLPPVGDPKKARWRAAHFLYYQRDDPEQLAQQLQQQSQSGNDASSSGNPASIATANKATPPKPKYVIYEGEMVDSKREGRGVCLYTDGNMYEGEWKRNKEHGYGKLMSSDRKKIIYEGEWERGRMQGTGTYYYISSHPDQLGPRYVGEFRENLRNGIGRYFLPDGSVYDGQWRDGVMNGLGVFTWPDNSMYDGVWKDGKRNGQGLMKKADGFVYDGQWVNNTMEGRGSAIYPNGQRYEGSFSNGRREGRGTIIFTNGAVYEGRFRDDAVDGQGTMKMSRTMIVPRDNKSPPDNLAKNETKSGPDGKEKEETRKDDFMIPISFQSDMTRILTKTGFM
eukprot:CAMPEP_0197177120 /NCGR_PEP_ID=MMETSP1423-20130617/2839_1 /TAXON_ID=476441 /ORGANISM="Pseudo-nitzschia heimii, Strain UNC1101" /LENGTH=1107 /DNA_ID=CAMNT_0042626619 /DNA_START=55 /DNA_END=3378 /DNA_ORIENTATION=+